MSVTEPFPRPLYVTLKKLREQKATIVAQQVTIAKQAAMIAAATAALTQEE